MTWKEFLDGFSLTPEARKRFEVAGDIVAMQAIETAAQERWECGCALLYGVAYFEMISDVLICTRCKRQVVVHDIARRA